MIRRAAGGRHASGRAAPARELSWWKSLRARTLETIRSASHPLLKRARAAAAGRARGVVLLEGDRLVDEGRRAELAFEVVLVSEERGERLDELVDAGLPVRAVRTGLLAAASRLETPPGCLALAAEPRGRTVADLPLGERAFLAAAAGLQDPGNLGALARTAEAAGASALLATAGGCSPWNPKALRGSMGSLLRLPVIVLERPAPVVGELSARGVRHVLASARGGAPYDSFDWSGPLALWFTAETGALPGELEPAARGFEAVTIPMSGGAESLNVTAAAAVLLFAAAGGRKK